MRIQELAIDGFGAWSDLRIVDFDTSINVLYGANEAGKTTLMQFLRTMLYGFSNDRRQRYLPPLYGRRAGGSIALQAPRGNVRVERRLLDANDMASDESLVFTMGGSSTDDAQALPRLLGNVDEAVFRNVFAIGLREIQELGALSDTDAAQMLYRLATGLDRVSLVDVLRELKSARERLLNSGSAASTISQLFAEQQLLAKQADSQESKLRYLAALGERERLMRDTHTWESEASALEHSASLTELAASVHERWLRREAIDRELAALNEVPRADQTVLDRYEAVLAAISRMKRRRRKLVRRLAENRQEIDCLGLNRALWRQAARVEAILEQDQWITSLDAERRALGEKTSATESERASICTQLGIDPSASIATASSAHAWRTLKPVAKSLRQARAEWNAAREDVQSRSEAADASSRELSAAIASRGEQNLLAALERSGTLVSQLRRRVQLDDRLAELARRQGDLESRSRDLLTRLLLPGWALVLLGIAFVAGIVGVLAAFFLPASIIGDASWALVAFSTTLSAGAAATKYLLERSFQLRADACLTQLDTLEGQIKKGKEERDSLDEQLPRGGGPLLARLQSAEKEHAALEVLLPIEATRHSAAQALEGATARERQCLDSYREARRRWQRALDEAGLPPTTSPRLAREMAKYRQRLAEIDARLAGQRADLRQRQEAVATFDSRMAQLQVEFHLPLVGQPLADQFRVLREHLREQASLAERRAALSREARRIHAKRERIGLAIRRGRRHLESLLERAGVVDVAELRRRALRSARGDLLASERETLSREIASTLGAHASETDVAVLVANHARGELVEQARDLLARLDAIRQRIKASLDECRRLEQTAQLLIADRRAANARLKLGAVRQRLRAMCRRWQILATTEMLLSRVRKKYERERQPETLREASTYFARLTEGRYTRVWTPLDEDILRVDDASSKSLSVDVLSRGTREQLYLSLRLALANSYARRGIELPIILDDVLVNFDAKRAQAAAELLSDFAADGHQLVVFTCHEHIYRLFRSLDVAAGELPANPRGDRPVLLSLKHQPASVVASRRDDTPVPIVMEPAPPASNGNGRSKRHRPHVQFDTLHATRGPFATAIWHQFIADELGNSPSNDAEELQDRDDEQGAASDQEFED